MRSVGPGWFALVMATGIVSTAGEREGFPRISLALLVVAAVSYAVLVVLSLVRLWRWPAQVRSDLATPPGSFGFFAVVAGSAVLGERLAEQQVGAVSLTLLAIAVMGWLVLGYAVPAVVVLAPEKPGFAASIDGNWLLWVVATQAVSTAAALTAERDSGLRLLATVTAVTTWAVGVVLYVSLLTLLLLRLLVVPVSPQQMTPSYWIVMGATAITVLAGSRILRLDRTRPLVHLSTPLVEGLSLLLWAFGTWTIPLLVVFGAWRHVLRRHRLAYTPQLWTVVFPLGMYSVATAEFGRVTGLPFLAVPARIAFWVALAAWVAAFAAMLASLVAGRGGWKMGRRTWVRPSVPGAAATGRWGVRQPRSDVARNRRLLVEAAIESFQEFGWDVPLDTVARRAGVGNATLYRHFPTRDDLHEAAFAEIHERLVAVLARYQDVDDGWRALRDLVFEIYATAPVGPAMGTPAQERLDNSPSLRSVVMEVGEALDRLLRLAQSQGTVRTDVDLDDLGLLLDSVRPVVAASDKVAPELWRRHLALVLDALRAGPAGLLPPPVADAAQRRLLARAVRHS